MKKYLFLLVLCILSSSLTYAQKGYLEVKGRILKDRRGLDGAEVKIYKNSGLANKLYTEAGGKFTANLDFNAVYVIEIAFNNCYNKSIEFNTQVEEKNQAIIYKYPFSLDLIEKLPNLPSDPLNKPIARVLFNSSNTAFEIDDQYTKSSQAEFNKKIIDATAAAAQSNAGKTQQAPATSNKPPTAAATPTINKPAENTPAPVNAIGNTSQNTNPVQTGQDAPAKHKFSQPMISELPQEKPKTTPSISTTGASTAPITTPSLSVADAQKVLVEARKREIEEAKARRKKEDDEKLRLADEEKTRKKAEENARIAQKEVELKAKKDAEQKAFLEAQEKAFLEKQEQERLRLLEIEKQAQIRAQIEEEERKRIEKENKTRAAEELRRQLDAEEQQRIADIAKSEAEAHNKAEKDAEARAKRLADDRLKNLESSNAKKDPKKVTSPTVAAKKSLSNKVSEETITERDRVINKTIINTMEGTEIVLQKVTYGWGGNFYFKDNASISEDAYNEELEKYKPKKEN